MTDEESEREILTLEEAERELDKLERKDDVTMLLVLVSTSFIGCLLAGLLLKGCW